MSNSKDMEWEWLGEILDRAFNDFYGYIVERDIIKAAHEYSEKTAYTTAYAAIQSKVEQLCREARVDELKQLRFQQVGHDHDTKEPFSICPLCTRIERLETPTNQDTKEEA